MNKRLIFFALIVLLLACKRKTEQSKYWMNINLSIEIGFKKAAKSEKPTLLQRYLNNNGLCWDEINLYSDSTFEKESGCVTNTSRAIGKWKIKKNNLVLNETPLNELNLINDYSISGDTSRFFVISVSNRFDKPLRKFPLEVFNKAHKTSLFMNTDENGVIILRKEAYDSISITVFKELTNKVFTIKREHYPDSLKLQIFTGSQNYYGWPQYLYSKKESSFKIETDKIICNNCNLVIKKITNP